MKSRGSDTSDGAASANKQSALDEKAIDQLYGLEPVIDVEAAAINVEPTQFVTVSCPYCGESFETRVDLTGGSFEYIEDCQICCQAINLCIEVNDAGELMSLKTQQLSE